MYKIQIPVEEQKTQKNCQSMENDLQKGGEEKENGVKLILQLKKNG